MRKVKSTPCSGSQGTTALTTWPSSTFGNWVKTMTAQRTATNPANQASSLRAFAGNRAATMLPAKGKTSIKNNDIEDGGVEVCESSLNNTICFVQLRESQCRSRLAGVGGIGQLLDLSQKRYGHPVSQ